MKIHEFIYTGEARRADKILSEELGLSRSSVIPLFDDGKVMVNGAKIPKNHRISAGDRISAVLPEENIQQLLPENIPLEICFEDEDIIIINKPRGLVVHPGSGNPRGTLVNALLHHCGEKIRGVGAPERPGIVHRLDKNTSGLLVAAKTGPAYDFFVEALKSRQIMRQYEAVVCGVVKDDRGTIDAPIGRHPVRRTEMSVLDSDSAKKAISHYEVIERFKKYTHIRVDLETGRTHQIRVHMRYLGYPVAGDPVYSGGRSTARLSGQWLHSRRIGFCHPTTGEQVDIISELPEYFTEFLESASKVT